MGPMASLPRFWSRRPPDLLVEDMAAPFHPQGVGRGCRAAKAATTTLHPGSLGTLCGLFRARVAATPDQVAYRQFDDARNTWVSFTWAQVAAEVARWQAAL